MAVIDKERVILNRTVGVRQLDYGSEIFGRRGECSIVAHDELDVLPQGTRTHHGQGVREDLAIHKHLPHLVLDLLARTEVAHHRHGLGSRRRFVEQRAVSQWQTRQIADHRLEGKQRLQPTLRDLGLVGSVRGVPHGVLEDITGDDRRGERTVPAAADICTPQLVLGLQRVHRVELLLLGYSLNLRMPVSGQQYICRHDLTDQFILAAYT